MHEYIKSTLSQTDQKEEFPPPPVASSVSKFKLYNECVINLWNMCSPTGKRTRKIIQLELLR